MNRKTVLNNIDKETTLICDRFSHLSQDYYFEISSNATDNNIFFKAGYNKEDESIFILNKDTAIALGQTLIDYGQRQYAEKEINDNLQIQSLKLFKFISLGYIKEIYVYKTKNNTPYSTEDRTNHIYSIKPIFKHGIKSNHFNFSIACSVGFFNNYEERVKYLCKVLNIHYDLIIEKDIKFKFRNLRQSFIKDQEIAKEMVKEQEELIKKQKEESLRLLDERIKNPKQNTPTKEQMDYIKGFLNSLKNE